MPPYLRFCIARFPQGMEGETLFLVWQYPTFEKK